jgi:hypothetical protein
MRTVLRRGLAVVIVLLLAAACGVETVVPPTTSNGVTTTSNGVTTTTSPPSHPIPPVDVSATPSGWVPVDYGNAQVSVPPTFDVVYSTSAPCQIQMPAGTAFVGAPVKFNMCFGTRTSFEYPTVVSIVEAFESNIPLAGRHQIVNGITVIRSPGRVRVEENLTLYATAYVVPSLGVKVTVGGQLGQRILDTLTSSPRAEALASGSAPPIPSSWHIVTFDGLSFSVPKSWPITRTSYNLGIGKPCSTPGVALLSPPRVTLSTDQRVSGISCPLEMPTPQVPHDGVQVDERGQLPPHIVWPYSRFCLLVAGDVYACPLGTYPYSIRVLGVKVPGRTTPLTVSIGLARNGMIARTILYSLKAG